MLRAAAVEPNQEDSRRGSSWDFPVPAANHLASDSHAVRVRSELDQPQGLVSCFELDTNRAPETLSVHRSSSLNGVEFWSITGCGRPRAQLSDMFSASLVLGPSGAECGRVWTRGQERGFSPGDLLLADPGEVQRITPLVRPGGLFTIFWQPSVLEHAAVEARVALPLHWQLTELAAGPISTGLVRLRRLLDSGADARLVGEAYRAATFAILRGAAQSAEAGASRGPCHPGARRAAERLRESFTETLSLADLSSGVQLSKYHLARCFQQSLGVPPHRYRKLLRLQRARRLIERGLSVGDVARETGFADAPHLTRAFREWLGVSPAAWGNTWRATDPSSDGRPRTVPPAR